MGYGQNGQSVPLSVEIGSRSASFHLAFELAVVPFVAGVRDEEIVDALLWLVVESGRGGWVLKINSRGVCGRFRMVEKSF